MVLRSNGDAVKLFSKYKEYNKRNEPFHEYRAELQNNVDLKQRHGEDCDQHQGAKYGPKRMIGNQQLIGSHKIFRFSLPQYELKRIQIPEQQKG